MAISLEIEAGDAQTPISNTHPLTVFEVARNTDGERSTKVGVYTIAKRLRAMLFRNVMQWSLTSTTESASLTNL